MPLRRIIFAALVALAACAQPATLETTAGPRYKGPAVDELRRTSANVAAETERARLEAETAATSAGAVVDRGAIARAIAPPTTRARASRSAPRATTERPALPAGDIWAALARCESGGNPRAVGGGGRYFGAFQFSLGSWRATGMSGNPVDYDYATQLAAAQRLQARSGWGQWPHCARRLGLR